MIRSLLLFTAANVCCAAVFYVSPSGNDSGDGTKGKPFATLSRARQAVRALSESERGKGVTVLLRGGEHVLSEAFVLAPEDSGRPKMPVVWAAAPGEKPAISGAKRITGWKKGDGSVWTAPAPFVFRQMFVNGRRTKHARTPSEGFFITDGPKSTEEPFSFKFRGNDVRAEWAARGDVEFIGLIAWTDFRFLLTKVDEASRTAWPAGTPRASVRETDWRYWIENTPDALDAPGEWYLDSRAETVSYWPLPGEDLTSAAVVAPAIPNLVRLEGQAAAGKFVHDVEFRGLDFRYTAWTMTPKGYVQRQGDLDVPAALDAAGVEDITVEDCEFSRIGGYAMAFGQGAKRVRIVGNDLHDLASGGIKIGDITVPESEALASHSNRITDNHIHDFGVVFHSGHGVWAGHSGDNVISHNHIHDGNYTAISAGWTWGYKPNPVKNNRIEYNHLHHIGTGPYKLSDMGGIYTLGMQPGTVIRGNHIHDVNAQAYGAWGIYPDEGSTDVLIENNLVYRTKGACFHEHYGKENIIRNNIFWATGEEAVRLSRAEEHRSFSITGNILVVSGRPVFGGGYRLDIKQTRQAFHSDRNLIWETSGQEPAAGWNPPRGKQEPVNLTVAQWRAQGQDVNSLVADPLFVDMQGGNFRLRSGSPAKQIGFKPFDWNAAGVRPKGKRK